MEPNNQRPFFGWHDVNPNELFSHLSKQDDDHDTSLRTFVVSLGTNAAVFVVFFSLFLLMRRTLTRVYSPRTFSGSVPTEKQPDLLPNGVFAFLCGLYNLSDKYVLSKTSLDAYLFLRFLKMISLLCALATVATFILLVPVNAAGTKSRSPGLNRLSLSNLSSQEKEWFYVHTAVAWLFFPFVCWTVYRELRYFIALRNAYVTTPAYDRKVSSRTLLVMNVPSDYVNDMSGESLRLAFDGAQRVWTNKKMGALEKVIEKRKELVAELELAEVKYLQSVHKVRRRADDDGGRSRVQAVIRYLSGGSYRDYEDNVKRPRTKKGWFDWKKVDAIEWNCQKLYEINEKIKQLKESEDQKRLNSAFVYFESQKAAQSAYQCATFSQPCAMTPRFIGIHPEEVIWSNLDISWWSGIIRSALAAASVFVMVVFWAIPVGLVGSLSNIDFLTEKFNWLDFINRLPDTVLGFVKGYLPTLALAMLMMLVPYVIRFIAVLAGSPSRSHAELQTQKGFFFFQVVQVFLVTTISNSASAVLGEIAREPARVMPILAKHLPRSSNFYISYVILQGLSLSSSRLLQFSSVFFVKAVSPFMDNTPRKRWERWTGLSSYGWGSLYPVYTNLAVIAVAYAIIAPVILPFAAAGLAVLWMAYKYNFTFVYDERFDMKGSGYPLALQQLLTGVYIGELCLIGMFGLKGAKGPSALMVVLFVCTLFWNISMRFALGELLDKIPLGILDGGGVEGMEGGGDRSRSSRHKKSKKHKRSRDLERREREREHILTADQEAQEPLDESEETAPLMSMLSASSRPRDAAVDLVTTVLPDIVRADRTSVDDAYVHPSMVSPDPVVWIPRDEGGVMSRRQVDEIKGHGLDASDAHAWLEGKKAKLVWEPLVPNNAEGRQVNPPDYREVRLV